MAAFTLSKAHLNAVYDVLVEERGADESERDAFRIHWPDCREWRFRGELGMGGKVWSNHGRVYVTAYPEDITPERQARIDNANAALEGF